LSLSEAVSRGEKGDALVDQGLKVGDAVVSKTKRKLEQGPETPAQSSPATKKRKLGKKGARR
jgi:hypothetical protein